MTAVVFLALYQKQQTLVKKGLYIHCVTKSPREKDFCQSAALLLENKHTHTHTVVRTTQPFTTILYFRTFHSVTLVNSPTARIVDCSLFTLEACVLYCCCNMHSRSGYVEILMLVVLRASKDFIWKGHLVEVVRFYTCAILLCCALCSTRIRS